MNMKDDNLIIQLKHISIHKCMTLNRFLSVACESDNISKWTRVCPTLGRTNTHPTLRRNDFDSLLSASWLIDLIKFLDMQSNSFQVYDLPKYDFLTVVMSPWQRC